MSGKQRIYKQRISSTQTLQKVFRAMELIAASRIAAARRRAAESMPYDEALTQAVALVSVHAKTTEHPLTVRRKDTNRVAVVAVTSDRGMAGAYSATILRETERLIEKLIEKGRVPVLYTVGRRAESYFKFRNREIEQSWSGESDSPSRETITEIANRLVTDYSTPGEEGLRELYLVYTRFKSMVSQEPEVRKMLPLTVVKDDPIKVSSDFDINEVEENIKEIDPLYEFEPSPEAVLNELMPLYIRSRIRNALLQAAASELASRQQAMNTATDNAEELITKYTRLANTARQAEITQEISEIVSGADALAAG